MAQRQLYTMDLANPDDYRVSNHTSTSKRMSRRFFTSLYLPSSAQIVELLGQAGLNGDNVKLLLEKPFGVDLVSAQDMIEHVGRHYDESQVYRIDHYLAKEMAQNILSFRGRNALFAHVWNNTAIERIDVIALESIDIEGRAHFYEQAGALRVFCRGI